jgi:hypothetical protein
MNDTSIVRGAIRSNNRMWWCLYYDELYEIDDLQCTYLRDAGEAFYNCAQAIGHVDDKILDFIDDYYWPDIAPAVYTDPAAPQQLVPMLVARDYREIRAEREYWYRCDVLQGGWQPPIVKVAPERVSVVRVDPKGNELHDFVQINKVASNLPDNVASGLYRNLSTRSLRDVELFLYLALLDGRPAATRAVGICREMAFFAEGGTMPSARRLGLYSFLTDLGLHTAAASGARVAFATTGEDTNARPALQKMGFEIAWTRDYFRRSATDRPTDERNL